MTALHTLDDDTPKQKASASESTHVLVKAGALGNCPAPANLHTMGCKTIVHDHLLLASDNRLSRMDAKHCASACTC